MASIDQVLDIARSKLGYVEATGNDTPFGTWTGTPRQPWCHSFASWVLDQAGLGCGKIAYCPTGVNHWKQTGSLHAEPQPGDLFYLWFPKKKRYAHVGFVEKVEGDKIVTLEGNSNTAGSRTGGMVCRNRRTWAGTKTVFGRPAYTSEAPPKVAFGFGTPVVTPPIVAAYSPPEGGLRLVAVDGATFNFGGAPYAGPEPGRKDHDPLVLEPLVDYRQGPEGPGLLLAASGAVYAFLGGKCHGGPNMGAQSYFQGRVAATFGFHEDPARYTVVATSGERYGPDF